MAALTLRGRRLPCGPTLGPVLALPLLAGCGPTTVDVGAAVTLAAPLGWLVAAIFVEAWARWVDPARPAHAETAGAPGRAPAGRPADGWALLGGGGAALLGAALALWQVGRMPVSAPLLGQGLLLVPAAALAVGLLHARLAAAWWGRPRLALLLVPLLLTLPGLLLQLGFAAEPLATMVLLLVLWASGGWGLTPGVIVVLLLGEAWVRRRLRVPTGGRLLWSVVAGAAWAALALGVALEGVGVDAGPTLGAERRASCAQEARDETIARSLALDTPVPPGAELRLVCELPPEARPTLRLAPGAAGLPPASCDPLDTWPRDTQRCLWTVSPLPDDTDRIELLDGDTPLDRFPLPPRG